jgi:hypothetical protein
MVYDTYIRTRFGAFWLVTALGISSLSVATVNWLRSGQQMQDGVPIVWLVGVIYLALRILWRLGKLERDRLGPPDATMNLLLETATALPLIGCAPVFWAAAL